MTSNIYGLQLPLTHMSIQPQIMNQTKSLLIELRRDTRVVFLKHASRNLEYTQHERHG